MGSPLGCCGCQGSQQPQTLVNNGQPPRTTSRPSFARAVKTAAGKGLLRKQDDHLRGLPQIIISRLTRVCVGWAVPLRPDIHQHRQNHHRRHPNTRHRDRIPSHPQVDFLQRLHRCCLGIPTSSELPPPSHSDDTHRAGINPYTERAGLLERKGTSSDIKRAPKALLGLIFKSQDLETTDKQFAGPEPAHAEGLSKHQAARNNSTGPIPIRILHHGCREKCAIDSSSLDRIPTTTQTASISTRTAAREVRILPSPSSPFPVLVEI